MSGVALISSRQSVGAEASANEYRVMRVISDCMAPTLRHHHLVAIVPSERFEGDGLYIVDLGIGETIMRAERKIGAKDIECRYDNQDYAGCDMDVALFQRSLRGKVFAIIDVIDAGKMPGAA